jgi:hypothetical protein
MTSVQSANMVVCYPLAARRLKALIARAATTSISVASPGRSKSSRNSTPDLGYLYWTRLAYSGLLTRFGNLVRPSNSKANFRITHSGDCVIQRVGILTTPRGDQC